MRPIRLNFQKTPEIDIDYSAALFNSCDPKERPNKIQRKHKRKKRRLTNNSRKNNHK